jgi:sulfatase maturation enzyme AslB (radical SAM superfamily)
MGNTMTYMYREYPCDCPFSQLYLVPREKLDIRFCCYHAPLALLDDYEKLSLDDFHMFLNKNPHAIKVREAFLSGDFDKAGCSHGCFFFNEYKVTKKGFALKDYLNQDNEYSFKKMWLSAGPDCNLSCRYCLDYKNFVVNINTCNPKFLDIIVPFVHEGGELVYTGGETFLPKWNFKNQLKKLSEFQNNKGKIQLHTNGTYLDDDTCNLILKAPFESIGISMDTYKPELFNYIRRGSDFFQVFSNAKRLLDLRNALGRDEPNIIILCAVLKSTAGHLHETIDFYCNHGFQVNLNVIFKAYFSPDFCDEESLSKLSHEELEDLYRNLLLSEEKHGSKLNSSGFKGELLDIIDKKKRKIESQVILGGGGDHAPRKVKENIPGKKKARMYVVQLFHKIKTWKASIFR